MSEEAIDKAFENQLEAMAQVEELKREKEELLATRSLNSFALASASRKQHEINKKLLKYVVKLL